MTRLHLPHAIVVRLHVRKGNVVILTPETAEVGAYIQFTHLKMDMNGNAPVKFKSLCMVCIHYDQPASTSTKDVKSMKRNCASIFNLTKHEALLVPTKPYMGHNHEVNSKESVHYRTNLRLDGEDTEQANVMLVVRPQTENIHEALSGEHVLEYTPPLQTFGY